MIENSLLKTAAQWDYEDSFTRNLTTIKSSISSIDLGRSFFSSGPKWISYLFTLRNKIVSVFGLKISNDRTEVLKRINSSNFEIGERFGLFKVFDKNETEIVIGENDKHLDFRVSLATLEGKELFITTVVHYHNIWGKIYFSIIKPFHKVIVPIMLKGIVKNLEQ